MNPARCLCEATLGNPWSPCRHMALHPRVTKPGYAMLTDTLLCTFALQHILDRVVYNVQTQMVPVHQVHIDHANCDVDIAMHSHCFGMARHASCCTGHIDHACWNLQYKAGYAQRLGQLLGLAKFPCLTVTAHTVSNRVHHDISCFWVSLYGVPEHGDAYYTEA